MPAARSPREADHHIYQQSGRGVAESLQESSILGAERALFEGVIIRQMPYSIYHFNTIYILYILHNCFKYYQSGDPGEIM
jgi:hypothetical protein